MGVGKVNSKESGIQKVLDSANRSVNEIRSRPFYIGKPTDIKIKRYNASMGELVLCDPTTEGFTVILPEIGQGDLGKTISIVNVTSSENTITIMTSGKSNVINGETSDTIDSSYGNKFFIVIGRKAWAR